MDIVGGADPNDGSSEGRDPMTGLDAEGKSLLQQIAELNRAHEEAHRKLSQLQTSQLQVLSHVKKSLNCHSRLEFRDAFFHLFFLSVFFLLGTVSISQK